MIKVSITRQGIITNEAQFPTQPEAEAWFNEVASTGAFGKLAGQYMLSQLSESELATEISLITEKEIDGVMTPLFEPLVTIPDQFTVTYTDITEEIAIQKEEEKYLRHIQFAMSLKAKLAARNKREILAGRMTVEQAAAAETKLAKTQRLLDNGSLGFALAEISAIESTLTEFPAEYIAELKNMIIEQQNSEV